MHHQQIDRQKLNRTGCHVMDLQVSILNFIETNFHFQQTALAKVKNDYFDRKKPQKLAYSTVTDFAKLRGLSTSVPRAHAV